MPDHKVLPAGDTALVVELGEGVDREISARVLALAQTIAERRIEGVLETIPTFRSLLVHYDPLVLPADVLTVRIGELMQQLQVAQTPARAWELPACYDPQVAPDLEDVARRTGLSPAQLVEQHSNVSYYVYMLGFLPGQAYMGDLPGNLSLARRESPRPTIPAGSLAIAGSMTCIFPQETPCGWHLIGRSPVPLWETEFTPRALLAPGDQVRFMPISLGEYEILRDKVAAGGLKIMPRSSLGIAA
ncbi:MAG: 5-oxoprolinase subunit PxpB [Xanthobacteraceae bacterium]|jgi:inhibitor of KinA